MHLEMFDRLREARERQSERLHAVDAKIAAESVRRCVITLHCNVRCSVTNGGLASGCHPRPASFQQIF